MFIAERRGGLENLGGRIFAVPIVP